MCFCYNEYIVGCDTMANKSEEKAAKVLKKDMRTRQITLLVQTYYDKFDFLHNEPVDLLVGKALDTFLDSDLSIDEINEKLVEIVAARKKAFEDRYDEDKVKDNHKEIYSRLEQLAKELNKEGIDYQLAGALCGYIKYGQESDRCHDDIDICLNEEQIGLFKKICLKLGLTFEDNRMDSPRVLKNGIPCGEHEVIARDPNSSFHIGVFPFERIEDGTIISKGYYHDEDGSPCVREEIYLRNIGVEVFGREEVDFRGIALPITPPEYVYMLKSYTKGQKDVHDIQFLSDKIDVEKLERLRKLSKEEKVVQNVPVKGLPDSKSINPYNEDNDDLSLMFTESGPKKDTSKKKEGEKVFMKKSQLQQQDQQQQQISSEEGFISNTIITTLALITFVLCFIGLAVIYLVQM